MISYRNGKVFSLATFSIGGDWMQVICPDQPRQTWV